MKHNFSHQFLAATVWLNDLIFSLRSIFVPPNTPFPGLVIQGLVCCKWVHFFRMIQIRNIEHWSLRSCHIKATDESLTSIDSLVSLMHHGPSDLGSLILVQVISAKCTLNHFTDSLALLIWQVKIDDNPDVRYNQVGLTASSHFGTLTCRMQGS